MLKTYAEADPAGTDENQGPKTKRQQCPRCGDFVNEYLLTDEGEIEQCLPCAHETSTAHMPI